MKTILVVEDEPAIARLVRDYLEQAGFAVVVTGDGNEAIRRAQATSPDLVVLDLGLRGGMGSTSRDNFAGRPTSRSSSSRRAAKRPIGSSVLSWGPTTT